MTQISTLYFYTVNFVCSYDYDMFHIPLSYDILGDLWNEYMYMYYVPGAGETV